MIDLHEVEALKVIEVRKDVVLRPMEKKDAAAIMAILTADPTIRDHVTVAAKLQKEHDIIKSVSEYQADPRMIRYSIVEAGQVVGLVSLWGDEGYFDNQPKPNIYGFGYFLDPKARGRGLVSDSLRALMKTLQASITVESFIAFCEHDNSASLAVLKKVGFQPTNISYEEPVHKWREYMYEKKPSHE